MSQLCLDTNGSLGDAAGFGIGVARELEDADKVGFVASEDLLDFGGRLDVVAREPRPRDVCVKRKIFMVLFFSSAATPVPKRQP